MNQMLTGAIAVAAGSRIGADATIAGNGGDIRLMGERTLRAYGTITARGGPAGGNGGFIETSGGYAVPAGARHEPRVMPELIPNHSMRTLSRSCAGKSSG